MEQQPSTLKDQIGLSSRDLDLLMDLSLKGYRYLNCGHLRLLGYFPEESACKDGITRLLDAGLVMRLFLPIVTQEMASDDVYILSRLGARFLAQTREISPLGLAGPARPSPLFMEHGIKISDFMCSLEAALSGGQETRLVNWKSEFVLKAIRARTVKDSNPWDPSKKLPVIPDGLFSLETNSRVEHYSLEADRGTMGIESIRRKMLAYVALFRQGLHKTAYGLPHFRVLLVTTTPYRQDRFRAALRNIGYCQNMFLFTIWKKVSSETIVTEPIWMKANSQSPVRLLD